MLAQENHSGHSAKTLETRNFAAGDFPNQSEHNFDEGPEDLEKVKEIQSGYKVERGAADFVDFLRSLALQKKIGLTLGVCKCNDWCLEWFPFEPPIRCFQGF